MNKNKAIEGVAVLASYHNTNIEGFILFKEDLIKKETIIKINLKNVPIGIHGFHIHRVGDLREGCSSLCSHYNPKNKNHGGPNDKERHIGDLGNIISKNGFVNKTFRDKLIKLRGKYSVIGRSVVIHADEDDLGKGDNVESLKTGNAGKRIACGVIGYSKNC
jgi:superoxide dismutase, Cu-Zn family